MFFAASAHSSLQYLLPSSAGQPQVSRAHLVFGLSSAISTSSSSTVRVRGIVDLSFVPRRRVSQDGEKAKGKRQKAKGKNEDKEKSIKVLRATARPHLCLLPFALCLPTALAGRRCGRAPCLRRLRAGCRVGGGWSCR